MFKINKLTSSNISELIFELIESNSYSLSTYSLLIISIICLVKEEVSSLFCSLIIELYLLRTKFETIDIIGPAGRYHAVESTIVADRHIHMSAEDLVTFNRSKGEVVTVEYENGVILDDVHIKSDETCRLELHMNKDEAEKLGIETGMSVKIC